MKKRIFLFLAVSSGLCLGLMASQADQVKVKVRVAVVRANPDTNSPILVQINPFDSPG